MDSAKTRQPPLFKIIAKVTNFFEKISAFICGSFVILMLVIVSLQIFARAGSITVSWTEEASRYILIWIGMLSGGIALKQKGHAAVGFITEALPKKIQSVISIAMNSGILVFMVVFFWTGLTSAIAGREVLASAFEISMFWPKMAVPVGAAFIILNCVYLIAYDITEMKYGEEGVKE